jgi:hypothetical protein
MSISVSFAIQLVEEQVLTEQASNILDVPNFFWDSEPTLHPLYFAIREYLEITPRIKVLNERCRVFLDLAEILSDSIADTKMSTITWIIIVLIVISIAVTVSEVGIRFALLEREKSKWNLEPSRANVPNSEEVSGLSGDLRKRNWTELRETMSLDDVEALCGAGVVGTTFAGV